MLTIIKQGDTDLSVTTFAAHWSPRFSTKAYTSWTSLEINLYLKGEHKKEIKIL